MCITGAAWQCLVAVLLSLCIAADAAAVVEHSFDDGRSFTTAGRILLDDTDAVGAVFERQAISSTQLSQLQQLVESDRWAWALLWAYAKSFLVTIRGACYDRGLYNAECPGTLRSRYSIDKAACCMAVRCIYSSSDQHQPCVSAMLQVVPLAGHPS
jgi:hypothetical protein